MRNIFDSEILWSNDKVLNQSTKFAYHVDNTTLSIELTNRNERKLNFDSRAYFNRHICVYVFCLPSFSFCRSFSVSPFHTRSLLFFNCHLNHIWTCTKKNRVDVLWRRFILLQKKCSCSILIIVANQHGPIVILWNEQLWFSHLSSHLEKCHLSINTLSQHEQCSLFLYQIYFVYGPNIQ